jgi:hypothetical protein
MTAQWAFRFGRIYGVEVPDAIRADDIRLKDLLEQYCQGPYDETGVQIGLGVYFEGGGVALKKFGVRVDPFGKDIVSAGIYLKREEWDRPIEEYRRLLWRKVVDAINGCLEKLEKKQIPFDSEMLHKNLLSVESSYLGVPPNVEMFKEATDDLENSVAEEDEDSEGNRVVVQYRIECHGRGSDHDKRVVVENLLGEFLEEADLGYCDGGDIGSGTMNVFCFVKPGKDVGKKVIEVLRKNNLLEGAVIAETDDEGGERVAWPPDFKGDFQLI